MAAEWTKGGQGTNGIGTLKNSFPLCKYFNRTSSIARAPTQALYFVNLALKKAPILELMMKTTLSIAALTAATFSLPAAAAGSSADAAKCGPKCSPAKVAKQKVAEKKCGAKCGAKCAPKCGAK